MRFWWCRGPPPPLLMQLLAALLLSVVIVAAVIQQHRINKLKPKTVTGVNKSTTMPFKLRENINKFLQGCRALGVEEHSMFTTADL